APAATAGPEGRELIRKHDGGTIQHIDAPRKALQERNGHRIGGHEVLDRRLEQPREELDGGGSEPLVESLRRDGNTYRAGHLRQLLYRCLGGAEPAKDHGLGELSARQL